MFLLFACIMLLKPQAGGVTIFHFFLKEDIIKSFWILLQLYITVIFGKKKRNETTNLELICDPKLKNIDFEYTS